MGHGAATNSIEVEAPALFDRVARKWNVDYAFYLSLIHISEPTRRS